MWKTVQMNYTRVADAIQNAVDAYTGEGEVKVGVAESTLMLYVDGTEMPIAEVHQQEGGHVAIDFNPELFEFDEELFPVTDFTREVAE